MSAGGRNQGLWRLVQQNAAHLFREIAAEGSSGSAALAHVFLPPFFMVFRDMGGAQHVRHREGM